MAIHRWPSMESTRWSTTLSSKVNLHRAINFRGFRAMKWLRYPAVVRGTKGGERNARSPPSGWGKGGIPHEGAFRASASIPGIPLEPLIKLRVDVTLNNHSGFDYVGMVPRIPFTLRSWWMVSLQTPVQTTRGEQLQVVLKRGILGVLLPI